jgi:uncharacterized protein (DUF488 family)
MRNVVHMMGLGERDLGTILEMLVQARVARVVDVRRYGSSARYPQHAAGVLHRALRAEGVEVADLGDLLGGDRPGGYRKYMATGGFRSGLASLEALAAAGPVMVLCAERRAERCHRRFLAAALEERGWPVAHHESALSERRTRGEMRLVRKTG